MLGSFSEESLQAFAEVCLRPDGKVFGTPGKCQSPNKNITAQYRAAQADGAKKKKEAAEAKMRRDRAINQIMEGKGAKAFTPGSKTIKIRKYSEFSEFYDYKLCQRPDKTVYGIPDDSDCGAPNKEVAETDKELGKEVKEAFRGYEQWAKSQNRGNAKGWALCGTASDLLSAFGMISEQEYKRFNANIVKGGEGYSRPSETLQTLTNKLNAEEKKWLFKTLKKSLGSNADY